MLATVCLDRQHVSTVCLDRQISSSITGIDGYVHSFSFSSPKPCTLIQSSLANLVTLVIELVFFFYFCRYKLHLAANCVLVKFDGKCQIMDGDQLAGRIAQA